MHDDAVTVTCSTSKGYPIPLLTASIVDSNQVNHAIIRELKETSDIPAIPKEDPVDQTWSLTKSFTLFMTEDDVGKYVQCSSDQGAVNFGVIEYRKLAIWCGCKEEGSKNLDCDTRTGKCECYPNYSGLNCDECAYGFENYPKCTGKDGKSALKSKIVSDVFKKLYSVDFNIFRKLQCIFHKWWLFSWLWHRGKFNDIC